MGGYKILKKSVIGFKPYNVIKYIKNRDCSIIIYHLGIDVLVHVVVKKLVIFSSITINIDEFIEDRDKILKDDRINKFVRREFKEFCDKYYNLIDNLYGRDC